MPVTRIGGSFAPPLTDELLTKYAGLISGLPASPIKDAMVSLHNCCGKWWELPESVGDRGVNDPLRDAIGKPHASGLGLMIPLEDHIAKTLWEHIPWQRELDAYARLFEEIDNGTEKELRDAAHHLLWHVVELGLDREPMTTDKL